MNCTSVTEALHFHQPNITWSQLFDILYFATHISENFEKNCRFLGNAVEFVNMLDQAVMPRWLTVRFCNKKFLLKISPIKPGVHQHPSVPLHACQWGNDTTRAHQYIARVACIFNNNTSPHVHNQFVSVATTRPLCAAAEARRCRGRRGRNGQHLFDGRYTHVRSHKHDTYS